MSDNSPIPRTIRLNPDVAADADAWCDKHGSSFSDFADRAFCAFLGRKTGAGHRLLDAIAGHVRGTYGNSRSFPPDVTLQEMHRVKADKALYELYLDALAEQAGKDERHKRQQLHSRVAKAIKKVLGAENGRIVLGLDAEKHLLQGFTELLPE